MVAGGVGDKEGGTGEMGERPWVGFGAVWGRNPPVNVLGGAGGADCRGGGEKHTGGGGGGSSSCWAGEKS